MPYNPSIPNRKAFAKSRDWKVKSREKYDGREVDPANTWGAFRLAISACQSGNFDGIGFELEPGGGIVIIDLDNCRDSESGKIDSWAREIVDRLKSYSEVSPSQTGIRILCRGDLPTTKTGKKTDRIEMYQEGRFGTITGHRIDDTPAKLAKCRDELHRLFRETFGEDRRANKPAKQTKGRSNNTLWNKESKQPKVDDDYAEGAFLVGNVEFWGDDGAALIEKGWSEESGYESQSQADLAICNWLAVMTRDPAAIDALFRRTALYRDKWERLDYREETIRKAMEFSRSFWGETHESTEPQLPEIITTSRPSREIRREAISAIQQANNPPRIFLHGGKIGRVSTDERGKHSVQHLDSHGIQLLMADFADFKTVQVKKDGESVFKHVNPPKGIAQQILVEQPSQLPFPPLEAIVETPVVRPNGGILHKKGYDAETRLFYTGDLDSVDVPQFPTQEDTQQAAEFIQQEVLTDFPLKGEADRASAFAAMLTPLVRPTIGGCTPMILFNAPTPGTGKGLLADVVGVIATGRAIASHAVPEREEEIEKRITSLLAGGSTIVLLDEITTLRSSSLSSVLTRQEWAGRLLGKSEEINVPNRATWLGAGNNIALRGDLPRRCVFCNIDPKMAKPWKRKGYRHEDLLGWVSEHRGEVLSALLTMTRAWFVAGKPKGDCLKIGSFTEWCNVIGGILHFAGIGGFLAEFDSMYDQADEEAAAWEDFLGLTYREFEGSSFPVSRLRDEVLGEVQGDVLPREIIEALDTDKLATKGKRLGQCLKKRQGRVFGTYRVEMAGEDSHTKSKLWRVVKE